MMLALALQAHSQTDTKAEQIPRPYSRAGENARAYGDIGMTSSMGRNLVLVLEPLKAKTNAPHSERVCCESYNLQFLRVIAANLSSIVQRFDAEKRCGLAEFFFDS
jgi:hypothetical protein